MSSLGQNRPLPKDKPRNKRILFIDTRNNLRNGRLVKTEQLLVDLLQAATFVNAKNYDGIALVFAVQGANSSDLHQTVGFEQSETHAEDKLKHLVTGRFFSLACKLLISVRFIKL